MIKYFAAAALLLIGSSTVFGQERYGHLNLGELVAAMTETKAAETELQAYQKELVAKGEEMAEKLQTDYNAFVQEVQGGNLTPVQQQERQKALQDQQQAILAYEQEIMQQVGAKREELLGPVIERAEKAIAEVAKENNFAMIFDTSIFNTVLFAAETEDIMPMVKAKLGIKEETTTSKDE